MDSRREAFKILSVHDKRNPDKDQIVYGCWDVDMDMKKVNLYFVVVVCFLFSVTPGYTVAKSVTHSLSASLT